MDIPKNGSFNLIFYLSLIIATTVVVERESLANTRVPAEVLIASYRLPPVIEPAEARSVVADLERALVNCEDNYLAFRIRYRIGVIYFKAGFMRVSRDGFIQIAYDPECPEFTRACSLNMIGQISRLEAENKEALEAFNQMANLLKQYLSVDDEYTQNSEMIKLWCSALLSRAEIYELQKDYTESITEYSRLLNALRQSKDKDLSRRYAPLANDRISQLYLREGDTDKYIQLVEALTERYPEYCRTPIIRFELECIKFLKTISATLKFPNGSYGVPARLITYFKTSNGGTPAKPVVDKLNRLCKEYQNTCWDVLLQYHYAWLLDALGEKHKAAETFAKIFSKNFVDANNKSMEKIIAGTIQEYAKIQYAIIIGELADYKEALRVLSSMQTHPNKSHISELVESVTESIQILKREVPKNEI